ncbi:MAG: asparagine synthase (glutamine-hydrolyzing) [Verrucomicrobiales bacterium]|nr:asparagine synthase (glutamine-hydrolyzing) [Verrucomicrobiales bacterium]
MCAVAGIVDWNRPAEWLLSASLKMSKSLAHRGPDSEGSWHEPNVALSHRRLALIDLEGGHQPITDPADRFVLVFNGEIYNYRELRNELKSEYPFQTESDTEVLLAAWTRWGKDCLSRLNGMFAFFIWDRESRTGFAARDTLGIKPLAYCFKNGTFAFASEAKALLTIPDTSPKADLEAILEYLVAPCFSGVSTSPFQDIEYLQPGQCLEISRDGLQLETLTNLFDQPDHWISGKGLPDSNELQTILPKAVARALTSDVPVGTYLSGGFDSTLITAQAKRWGHSDLKAFSIAFDGHEKFDTDHSGIVISDDCPFAREAAREIGVDLDFVPVADRSINDLLQEVTKTNDALPAWEQELAQHSLARAAARQYKAVLVGDAADETHYGYQFLLSDEACRSPSHLFENRFAAPIRRSVMSHPIAHFDEKYRTLVADSAHNWDTAENRRGATTYLIVKRWLPRLLHNGDIHAMAHGLEARVPFGDTELLAFAQTVPPHLGFHEGREKSFLRNAARRLLPESIRTRTKSALPKPPLGWQAFQRELQSDLETTLDLAGAVLDPDTLRSLINRAAPVTEAEQSLLFRLAAMKHWFKHFEVSWS